MAAGSFAAPDHEYPSHLDLRLTAADSSGLSAVASVSLFPRTVDLTFETSPAGLVVSLDLGASPAPYTRTVIVGSSNSLAASPTQNPTGTVYVFDSWSDGGAASHQIVAPAVPTTYRATYRAPAELEVSQTASHDSPTIGRPLSFFIDVVNAGPNPAPGVVVTDTLPGGARFVSGSGAGWSCAAEATVVTCTRPTLAMGPAPTVRIDTVAPGVSGAVTNTASVRSDLPDTNPSDSTSDLALLVGLYRFHTLEPCRLVDTRLAGPALQAGSERVWALAGLCGIPSSARALALNVTVTEPSEAGDLRLSPPGVGPSTSTLNYGPAQTRAAFAVAVVERVGGVGRAHRPGDGQRPPASRRHRLLRVAHQATRAGPARPWPRAKVGPPMAKRFVLPAPPASPARGLAERARAFFLKSWPGRLLLAGIALAMLGLLGLPLPSVVSGFVRFVLIVFGLFGFFRLSRVALRALLWKIRSKLILSYLFVGLVPIVLASTFFVLAGVLLVNLVAAHLVTAEIDRMTGTLSTLAESVLPSLPPDDAVAARVLDERLAPARGIHQQLGYALVRHGQVVASQGGAPQKLPGWWKGTSFAGYVKANPGLLRVVRAKDALTFLLLEVPVDAELFQGLERRTGIHVLTEVELEPRREEGEGGDPRRGPRASIVAEGDHGERLEVRTDQGLAFVAIPEQTDWETGERAAIHPVPFRFHPFDLLKKLAPGFKVGGMGSLADALVYAMGVVGTVFLIVYAVALLLGLLLARSITRSVHALSLGTERLRQGDFDHAIAVRSRDQLGELAESFNHMSQGVKALLREQTEKERLEEELRIARQIQMSLLPTQGAITMPGVRIAALCLPAAEVGGDYYDLLPLSDTRLGVLVADVSGKGTSAALYMAELKGLVLSLSRIYASPAKLLVEANRILAANLDSRSFITMTYAVIDMVEGTMRYARAGHNPIIQLEAASGKTRVLVPQGLGLGIDRGERFEEILEEAVTPLRQGDIFLFFTDGLSEAMNGRSELFGESRLRDIVEAVEGLTSEEIKERILSEIRNFVGDAAPHDDMTLVVVKVA